MQLSTKGRYAVMAMTDLAGHGCDRAVSLAEIAERQQLSLAYLEQLFRSVAAAWIGAVQPRSRLAAYRLARAPGETSVAEVVMAVDEPLKATRCTDQGSSLGCMKGGAKCLTHDLLEETAARFTTICPASPWPMSSRGG